LVRFLVATYLIAGLGCGFEHGQLDTEDPAGAPDAGPPGTGTGSGSDSGTTVVQRTCKFPDAANKLCLEFDDGVLSPVVHDGSLTPHDATSSGLTAVMRAGSDPAAKVSYTSSLSIGETADLDIPEKITLEAWIRPDFYQMASIIRNEGQYVLLIDGQGHVGCQVAGVSLYSYGEGTVPLGQWTHIACTYDGQRVRVFRGGSTQDCDSSSQRISTTGSVGTTIAPGFSGQIDGVRIYARDIGTDICKHATGGTGCQRQCGISINLGDD
jgi:hypothetical protein